MTALTARDAEQQLQDAPLSPCMEGALTEMRELRVACLEQGIPALVSGLDDACGDGGCAGGCAPKARLLVREEDLQRVAGLMADRWREMVASLGVDPDQVLTPALVEPEGDGDPACPACGTAAPLVDGACSDCGLQLE